MDKENCKKYLGELNEKFKELQNASLEKWREVKISKGLLGVYLVYSNNSIIYVGSTNNLKRRIENDLMCKNRHTLHRTLLKEGKTGKEIQYFLQNKCQYKIISCKDMPQTRALEHFAIWVIKSKYNK